MRKFAGLFALSVIVATLAGCGANSRSAGPAAVAGQTVQVAAAEQERDIRSLIEQLVLGGRPESEFPPPTPSINDTDDYSRRYKACQSAFESLTEYKELAFPILVEHLKDKRESIPFRNHFFSSTVGDACYWNIYFQLQDRPQNYSEYGYARTGRDGASHPKPYWEGTPFDDLGGPDKWLEANQALSYPQMQVKCLRWLLDGEKKIGAPDAKSYFLNIHPLELRILERRLEAGENVKSELEALKKITADKIPPELLPAK